jgi:hypothetical protein
MSVGGVALTLCLTDGKFHDAFPADIDKPLYAAAAENI